MAKNDNSNTGNTNDDALNAEEEAAQAAAEAAEVAAKALADETAAKAAKSPGKITVCAFGVIAEVKVGEIQTMWGVPFTCEACEGLDEEDNEVESKRLVATLPAKEVEAMIKARRVFKVED